MASDGSFTTEAASPPATVAPRPPRVWPVFVAYVAGLTLAVFAQVVVTVALGVWLVLNGTEPGRLQDQLVGLVTTPAVFMFLALLSQAAMGLAAIIPARLSPEPALLRLRLVKPSLPAWGFPVVAIGTWLPAAVGLALAYALAQVLPGDESVARLYEQMTWPMAVPFILFIALAPGFTEELLFRGYMQGRLLKRWPAWVAILVTSLLFALAHVTPHAIVFVFPIGVWLGMVAWRTGSVWPTIAAHAFLNGSWNVWQVGRRLGVFPEAPPIPILAALGAAVVIGFFVSCWLLWKADPRLTTRGFPRPPEQEGQGHQPKTNLGADEVGP